MQLSFHVCRFGEGLCAMSWALNLVTKYGAIKGTYIMMVAIHNVCVCVEYCRCTVKQTYENMLNNIVKIINGL